MTKRKVFGVEMTDLESMLFDKYRSNPSVPAFNTISSNERFEITNIWLLDHRTNQSQQVL